MNDSYQLAGYPCITVCIAQAQYIRVLSESTNLETLIQAVSEHLSKDDAHVILISIIRLTGEDYDYLSSTNQYEVLL